jgi:hypothetical protein
LKSAMTDSARLRARTCTATYAIERGVTDRNPMSVATFERVVPLCFFARFVGGGFSLSTSTDDGDVNRSLNAYKEMRWEYKVERDVTFTRRALRKRPLLRSRASQVYFA